MNNKIRVYDTFTTIHPDDGINNLISSLQSAKEALKEQEELLENMVNEISFIKKVIKNLKNRIELLEKL